MIHAIEIEDTDSEAFDHNISRTPNAKHHQTLFEENLKREHDQKVDDLVNYFAENSTKPMMGIQETPLAIPQEPVQEKKKQKRESPGEIYRKQLKGMQLKKNDSRNKGQTNSWQNEEQMQSPSAMFNFEEDPDYDLFAISPERKSMEVGMIENGFENKEIPPILLQRRKGSNLSQNQNDLSSDKAASNDNDDSQYFLFDGNVDLLVECYSEEDEFIDINEVQRNPEKYQVIGGNADLARNLGKVILPKKPCIRVGNAFQCDIPPMHKDLSLGRTTHEVWDASLISHEKFEEYLTCLSALTGIKASNINEEKAAEILKAHAYNVEQAFYFCGKNASNITEKLGGKKKK